MFDSINTSTATPVRFASGYVVEHLNEAGVWTPVMISGEPFVMAFLDTAEMAARLWSTRFGERTNVRALEAA